LFMRYLLINPETTRIIILESMTCPFKLKHCIADILFRRFKVPIGRAQSRLDSRKLLELCAKSELPSFEMSHYEDSLAISHALTTPLRLLCLSSSHLNHSVSYHSIRSLESL
jgi:hypothetical protein